MSGCVVRSQNFGTECWNFWDCFGQFGTELLDCFWAIQNCIFRTILGSPGTDLRAVICSCVLFLHVVAKKMNNMLVVCKLCCYMRI